MKKLLTIILVLCIGLGICLMLTACGEIDDGINDANEDVFDNDNSSNNGSSSDNSSDSVESGDGSSNDGNEFSFTELVAVNNSECMITITSLEEDEIWGLVINIQLENKSSNKKYMFTTSSIYVNGVYCSSSLVKEVAAGKKANDKIYISDSDFEYEDIGEYSDIELAFRVYNSDDWLEDDVVNESVHVYPYGQNNAFIYNRPSKATDEVIVDNAYVKVIVTGYEMDDLFGYVVSLYLINKTDKAVTFNVEDASINGFMLDPFFARTISKGKQAFAELDWSIYDLEENNITTIEEIEFLLEAHEENDWFGENYFVNQTITLNP